MTDDTTAPKLDSREQHCRIKPGADCDKVLLVVLDNATLELVGMWEASYAAVIARLAEPSSKARNERGALSVGDLKRLARPIWPPAKTPPVTA